MSKRDRKSNQTVPERTSLRSAVPWAALAAVAREGREHWNDQLTKRERSRLLDLLKSSRGRPSALTVRERQEVQRLVGQLDLRKLVTRSAASLSFRKVTRGRGR